MDDIESMPVRTARGRWAPGQSGNPAGRKQGTRNRASLLRDLLDDEDVAAAVAVLRAKLAAGDGVAARFVLDRLFPKPRDREIDLGLPEAGTGLADLFDRVLWMMAAGEITIDEASRIVRLIQQQPRSGAPASHAPASRAPASDARATVAPGAESPASDLQTAGAATPTAGAAPADRPLNRHARRRAAALLKAMRTRDGRAPVEAPPPTATAA